MTPADLFSEIERRVPKFAAIAREHHSDNDELLAHVLMYDLLQFVGRHFCGVPKPGEAPTEEEVDSILFLLEGEVVGGDEATENAIAVSFVEDLEAEPFFTDLLDRFGPNLRAQHQRLRWSSA